MVSRISRPKADLYLCHGKCGLYKPASSFTRCDNRSNLVYSMVCTACRRVATGKWLMDYYERLKSDPVAQLKAIREFEAKKPDSVDGTKGGQYYKWLMAFNSLLSRLGLIDKKPPFDIVTYVNRKVKYGRLTTQEAEERIEDYYQRHPESRPNRD